MATMVCRAAPYVYAVARLPDRIVHCVDTWCDVTFAPLWPSSLGMSHSAGPEKTAAPSAVGIPARAAKELYMTALTADIAKFVATIQPAAVPERCNYGARIGMLDCVGAMIAGAE